MLAICPDHARGCMKSRAAICVAQNRPLEIDEIEVAAPRQGEVLIEIKASGLCHTDYHLIDGSMSVSPYPIVLGHEGAGVVVEVGRGVTSVAPGDHVLPVSMPECGRCRNCIEGRTNICLEFFKLFGADSPFSRRGSPLSQFLGCGTFSNYTTVKGDRGRQDPRRCAVSYELLHLLRGGHGHRFRHPQRPSAARR